MMHSRKSGSAVAAFCRRVSVAVAFCAALILAGGAGAQTARSGAAPMPQQSAAQTPGMPGAQPQVDLGYRLGSGDRVRITVYGQPELTGEYQVDGTGQLAFPLIGQVQAGGLTGQGLEQALVDKLKPDYLKNPSVSVEVLTYRPFYIVGEVKQPGSYPYVTGMSVINAIALAGGFTYRARESSFYVSRTGPNGEKTRLDATPETPVMPGDVITVRERYF
ncbi:polysaccharide biosynthesis/export family protein [Ferrovibrio sp.]|jgi:protein involved in polysaccharide export with SLBB domain|uniref:polysaccharide biosynthesis/export family protein n=1 Tax=Ferrovibrio sp. TaxID=1917215 RepID=UPI002B4AD562|nr:polysaccharide biosynthesis/export family protein [Ferrovibrio sp.]